MPLMGMALESFERQKMRYEPLAKASLLARDCRTIGIMSRDARRNFRSDLAVVVALFWNFLQTV